MNLGLRKVSTNLSALALTTGFRYSGTFGLADFGGTYIHRFLVAIANLPSLQRWRQQDFSYQHFQLFHTFDRA